MCVLFVADLLGNLVTIANQQVQTYQRGKVKSVACFFLSEKELPIDAF